MFLEIVFQTKISYSVRIKPTIASKLCEFFICLENLFKVSANFSGHLQWGVVRSVCYKNSNQCTNL